MILSTDRCRQFRGRRNAFTLLEVLVVCAIVVTLASVAGVGVFRYLEDSKKTRAQADCVTLAKAVGAYQTKNDNNFPASLNDVLRYLDPPDQSKLLDPWGKPYVYKQIQVGDTEVVYVGTTAPDGQEINNINVKQH